MASESKPYTAFTVPGRGLFQWRVMPFGLHSAPATFQRALDTIIGPELDEFAFAYLDDIVVLGSDLENHLCNLRVVFDRLVGAKLRINIEKCTFAKKEIRYLGHIISAQGIHTDPEKVNAVVALPEPTTLKELRSFLNTASWYRRFIPNFSTITSPLNILLKKTKKWEWGDEQRMAFEEIKQKLIEAPALTCPDFSRTFILQTDASDVGLGVVLTQEFEEGEKVIAYASRTLSAPEKNYTVTEKECLAIIWGIRKMRHYLEGYHFIIVTDHQSLKWLNSIQSPSGRIARWALEIVQFDYETTKSIKTGNLRRHIYDSSAFNEQDPVPWKLVIPKDERLRVLTECHDDVTAGHLGIHKTTARVTKLYYWPGMFRDIAKLNLTWHTVCADFVGPLPRSSHGNTTLIVFYDKFSKWSEFVAVRQATTKTFIKAFRERILARFGIPYILLTDNGTQFTSRECKKYFESLGIRQQFTAPYSPQENPTERTNRIIKTMIAQFTEHNQRKWDEQLPELSLALNSSKQSSTKFSPAYLTQGRELRLPNTVFNEKTESEKLIMDDNKFQRSCQRFREAMDRENRKRRKIVEIQSITYLPNLNMQSITGNQKKSDVLARLVEDLGIGEDDPHLDIPEVLASITPISPGKRTRFLVGNKQLFRRSLYSKITRRLDHP
ncbi:uncharacterized protein LOC119615583 [Lucilia sericata]|uniref:uncharacterized protein LOC119615583 n=1 Tax=Lucilia sericata TaxID=13632 RepID=UPI0018A8581F|nr:uncharacterized protein LOC119615583 [Lucilia sericata]